LNQKTPAKPPAAWSVPFAVADIPETGRRVDLVADDKAREAIAKAMGLNALPRLEAGFDLTRHGSGGVRVSGRVAATVVQNCVVTLEPVESAIDEAVDLTFQPEAAAGNPAGGFHALDAEDPPDALHDGSVDLGAVATEFMLLGIDPYPRKPGVVFDVPAIGDPSGHPFAALAALKKDGTGKPG
jgi:uncharacterized metal-binding protein YceD (DUF177 family)